MVAIPLKVRRLTKQRQNKNSLKTGNIFLTNRSKKILQKNGKAIFIQIKSNACLRTLDEKLFIHVN